MRRVWGERITAAACICIAVYAGIVALEFPAGGGSFPLFTVVGTVALSALMIVNSFLSTDGRLDETMDFTLTYRRVKPLLVAVLMFLYIVAIFEIGYYVSSILFLILSTLLVGIRNYAGILITGVVLFPAMYVFFELFLMANLPRGMLF